jgi:hypothetical protein
MKKKLAAVFFGTYLASLGIMIAADDFIKGVDFTGASSFSPSQLNQLVDNASPGAYRGIVIFTNSAPTAAYGRYIWLNWSTTVPELKVYSTNGGGWSNITATATIADGSITAANLASGSVITSKIAAGNVTADELGTGSVINSKIAAQAVAGTNIFDATITSTNIATGTIQSANIANAAITGNLIAPGVIGTYMLTNGFSLAGSNIANGTITSQNVANGGIALTNLATTAATTYSSLIYNGSSLAYDYPVVKYETNASMPTVANVTHTNLAGAGTFTHSLGGVPHIVRIVLVNKANTGSGGYSVGDEIGIESLSAVGQRYHKALYVPYADSTKVDLFWYREDTYSYINKGHTATVTCSGAVLAADWDFKIIAIRFKY